MPHFVISANRTADGGVVYLAGDRRWTPELSAAAAHPSKAATRDGLSWARTQEAFVCDPHPIKVKLDASGPIPVDTKQQIRAAGPEATLAALGFLGAQSDAPFIHRAELPADGAAPPSITAVDARA